MCRKDNHFHKTAHHFRFKIRESPNPLRAIHEAFTRVLEFGLEKARPHDMVGITIQNNNNGRKPIYISYRRADQIDSEILFRQIESVIQSDETFLALGPHQVEISIVEMIQGGARYKNDTADPKVVKKVKTSIVNIDNPDNLCLPRALVTGIAFLEKHESLKKWRLYENLRDERPIQTKLAKELCLKAEVVIPSAGGGIEELRKFQKYLFAYKIIVYGDMRVKNIYFDDETITSDKYIDLYYDHGDKHYSMINSMSGFLGTSYYCRACRKGYYTKTEHKCPNACKRCLQTPACAVIDSVFLKCSDCNLIFRNPDCLANHNLPHFANQKTVCNIIKYCLECRKINSLENIKAHKCGYTRCAICHSYLPYDHKCYIQTKKRKEAKKSKVFVFYDFECRQDKESQIGVYPHIINLAVLQIQCLSCIDNNDLTVDCPKCGRREHVLPTYEESDTEDLETIEADKILEKFFKIVRGLALNFKEVVLIAHNSRGYDGQFLLKYMVEVLHWEPNVIMCGGLIQSMQYDRLTFRDSLNFFNSPLSALPKMMAIQGAKKGFFPHYFNRTDTQHYIGELPAVEYYGADEMKPPQRAEFLKWWNEEKASGKIFNFHEEILSYCRSDVSILRQATLKFRQLFIIIGGVAPLESVTIAGACMALFRTSFLQANQIGIIPHNGYRGRDKQSLEALKWLKYEEKTRAIKIRTSEHGFEVKVGGYKVDGYCENYLGKKTVFEYHVSMRKTFFQFFLHGRNNFHH